MRAAASINDSEGILLKVCFTANQQCVWAVTAGPGCVPGESYPGIVNSDSQATSVELVCTTYGETNSFGISPYTVMQHIAEVDDSMGIVIPLEGGRFRVMRFSLRGAWAASKALESWTEEQPAKSTDDYTL